jgi:cysteinyl-tRNA synthetase
MLQAHYRSILDFSNDALIAAEKGYFRLMESLTHLNSLKSSDKSDFYVQSWKQSCLDAMNDDFNSPILIAQLFEAVKQINLIKDGKATINASDLLILKQTMNDFIFDVLGLVNEQKVSQNDTILEGVVQMLIDMRKQARVNKDFALSDQIRDQLNDLGIELNDGKEGTTFKVN